MNKKDFFLAAMSALEFKRRAFVISIFSLINEGPDDWKKHKYPYRLVQTPTGYFFVSPDNSELERIDDAILGQPLFTVKEEVSIKAGEVPYLETDIETTYGRLFFNYTAVIYPFNGKIPYQNKRVSPGDMEDLIVNRLKDNPEKDSDRNNEDIYVDEYLKFCDAMFYFTAFTQVCVPGATRKSMVAAPGIVEFKNKLLEQYKDRLTDTAVIATIDAALVQYDKDYLKGDAAEGFLLAPKYFNVVRKKLYGMHGAESGLGSGVKVDLIKNSLSEGWNVDNFPAMNNALRAGSFDRGASTMLGGESVKWLLRASSNMSVTEKDCGSKLGMTFDITDKNLDKIIGYHVIDGDNTIHVTNVEEAKVFIGKQVMVRSPMFCKLDKTDYCEKCVGDNLAGQPTGLSVAISDFGSTILTIFMAKMHGTQLSLAKMDYKSAIF